MDKIILLLLFLLTLLFIFSKNESFEDNDICSKIQEGECNSKLCPSQCKIQHSSTSDKCYCIERK
jgi:hypothetical protein